MSLYFNRILGNSLKLPLSAVSRSRLPQTEGRIYVRGLQSPVTVNRDQWGIPHIHAHDRHDLFFAQGFVHAQDRFWQMEMNRRVASGRLAALLGEVALDTDRLIRTFGFHRLAEKSWAKTAPHIQADIQAYTAGVNGYLSNEPALPVELVLLRHQPEPWTPLDSMVYARLLAWSMSHGWASELTRAHLIERLGQERAAELEPVYSERNPITLPNGIEFNRLEPDGMLRTAAGPFLNRSPEGGGRGSNGWVIAAGRSSTGHAFLANDMHLPVTSPALWYYNHLFSDDGLHVAGASLAGVPYVLVGHNNHIAWGATLSFADVEDLFVERFDPADPGRYQFGNQWRQADVFDERIEVKGRTDHIERVIVTHHGPVISEVLGFDDPVPGQALALSSMAFHPNEAFDGFAYLNEAGDWDAFVAAVERIESPSLNLVYADDQDNIGYYVSGRVPIRANGGQGLVPTQGWTGEHEWLGHIPFEQMPHCLNPKRGFLVSANHRLVDDDYPYYLGTVYMNGHRARRVESLITEREKVSPADCQQFHFDFHSIPGRELVERLAGLDADRLALGQSDAALSLRLLQAWDGWLGADTVGGTVYQVLLNRLAWAILEPALGSKLTLQYLGRGPHPIIMPISEFYGHWTVVLLRMLDNEQSTWLPAGVPRETILYRCLAETTAELRRMLGDDPQQWQWGRLHLARFNHTMGVQPPFDLIFNQGPVPIGGDTDTVNQTAIDPEYPYENNTVSVSYRQIVTPADWDQSKAMFAPGQSGHLGCPHYGDLIEPWLNGGYFNMTWTAEAVEASSRHQLRLQPALTGSNTEWPPQNS
jgi:penicillin G amidase